MINLEEFKKQFVLVVGDMMVDRYIIGDVNRISPEAPVPVLLQKKVTHKLGGTGNVILNVASLGAKVRAVGRVGADEEGRFFRQTLRQSGIDDQFLFTGNSTIVKTRVSACNQQFLRIDDETVMPPEAEVLNTIKSKADKILEGITVVIISDYGKGFVSEELAQCVIQAARNKKIPVLVDPKGKSAVKYRGASAITPNNKEFLDLTGLSALPDEEGIRTAALELCRSCSLEYVIMTRSEKGISTICCETGEKHDYPAAVKEIIDVTGAGDTVISVLALAVGAHFELPQSVRLANIAASIVISRFGAAQTTIPELSAAMPSALKVLPDSKCTLKQIEHLKKQGKKIVFTNGCFDLVHAGHISSFRQAKSLGDILVVGVNSDDSIRRIKGSERPVVDLKNRMTLLSALKSVDFVIPFDEDTPENLIRQIKPDILVKGKDWEGRKIAGDDFVRSYGGRVVFLNLEPGLSTTNIINKIKKMVK